MYLKKLLYLFVLLAYRQTLHGATIKFANGILEGLLFMNLYQLDKHSTKFTLWKYCKGCVKKLDGNDPNFLATTHGSCITTMHLPTPHCL